MMQIGISMFMKLPLQPFTKPFTNSFKNKHISNDTLFDTQAPPLRKCASNISGGPRRQMACTVQAPQTWEERDSTHHHLLEVTSETVTVPELRQKLLYTNPSGWWWWWWWYRIGLPRTVRGSKAKTSRRAQTNATLR